MMKRTIVFLLSFFMAPASGAVSALQRPVQEFASQAWNTLLPWCTSNVACAGVMGYALKNGLHAYSLEQKGVKKWVDYYARIAASHQVPDCPVKRKIAAKFAQHGYEVSFVHHYAGTTQNAAVLSHGKRAIFFVCGDGRHTFFTDPALASCRDGIIEHEIAHVLNGDIAQRTASRSFTKELITAGFTCALIKALTGDYTSFMSTLSSVSNLPALAKVADDSITKSVLRIGSCLVESIPAALTKSITEANTQTVGLIPSQVQDRLTAVGEKIVGTLTAPDLGTRVAACLGIKWLAKKNIGWSSALINAMVSRYHEKRADYAALKLKDPAVLRAMAAFFKTHSSGKQKKSWEQWWHEKLTRSHPCSCDRHRYLEHEAEKMSKAQKKEAAGFVVENEEVFA